MINTYYDLVTTMRDARGKRPKEERKELRDLALKEIPVVFHTSAGQRFVAQDVYYHNGVMVINLRSQ